MKKLLGLKHFDPRDFNNLFVGAFLMFGILFFIVISVYILMTNDYFVKEYPLYCNFQKGLGLNKGAAVQVNGVEVGSVEEVYLASNGTVRLELMIKKIQNKHTRIWEYNEHITSESTVYATRDQNLISGRIIFIQHGTNRGAILQPGDEIKAAEAQDIETVMNKILTLMDKFDRIANASDTLITRAKNPNSTVGALLADRELYTIILKQMTQLNNLNKNTNDIVSIIHESIRPLLKKTNNIVDNVQEISDKGHLVVDNVDTTVAQLRHVVLQTESILNNLNTLMETSEDKIERADDLMKGIGKFWFIEGKLPDLNAIPLIEEDSW